MRKIYLVLLSSFFVLSLNITRAATNEEINDCLSILSDQVKDNYWIDLSEDVIIDGNKADLSIYTWMRSPLSEDKYMSEVLRRNTTTEWCEYALDKDATECEDDYPNVFFAKRNNIWTLKITPEERWVWYWTATEFVTWGDDVGFQFPLKKRSYPEEDTQLSDYAYYDEWDDYGQMKQNLVYVQYLLDWTLLSCWFIKFDKVDPHTLNDLFQANYLWNAFEWGSFESLWKFNGWDYFWMKVRIPWLDLEWRGLFTMDLIAISYDNDSSFFNEYIAHQLQIKAMTDVSDMDWEKSMATVMTKYLDYLWYNTCFQIIHRYSVKDNDNNNTSYDLPSFCHFRYSDRSNLVSYVNPYNRLVSMLFDDVYAFSVREQDKKTAEEKQKNMPMPTIDGVNAFIWSNINKLEDKKLAWYILRALNPASKVIIKRDLESWKNVPYDDIVFLNCWLTHDQIVDNVEYIFKKYYKDGKMDLSDPEYLNPEFWDCIIPYPDRRNKNKFVEDSYLENKLQFIKNTFGEEKLKEYEKKISEVTNKYNDNLEKLKIKYSEQLASNNLTWAKETEKEIKNIYSKMETELLNISKNDPDFEKYISYKKETFKDMPLPTKSKDSKNFIYIFIGIWIFLILLSLVLIAYKNKNVNNKQN